MVVSASHRIARQTVELHVDTDAAARELYGELSESFRAQVAPVLDEVFGDVCPPEITMRIDRLEIDVGVVTRDGLMSAISIAMRDQLAARLTSAAAIDGGEMSTAERPQCLTAKEIALERVAAFLEHGVTTWRDAAITREALEATLIELIASAPADLRRVLERIPPAQIARRLWTQLRVAGRHGVLAWLGVADPTELDRAIAGWIQLLVSIADRAAAAPLSASSRDVHSWIVEQAWIAVMTHSRAIAVADVMADRILASLTIGAASGDAANLVAFVLAAAQRLLPGDHPVIRVIDARAAAIDHAGSFDARGERVRERHEAASVEDAAVTAMTTAGSRKRQKHRLSTRTESGKADRVASRREGPPAIAPAENGHDKVEAARTRATLRVAEMSRVEPSTRRRQSIPSAEPLWVAHAGAVIIWPFLQGYFEACGLTTEKRFSGDAARERAVLLTAYLATGAQEWGEHDLLLEKTLCGHPAAEPIASTIEVFVEEQRQANELLESVIRHWAALKTTSVDGLRRAFLSRSGTMTEISSAWKLEIPRAGHDVLLDRLPWGIGVVLLPWMEQPLHVEW